MFIVTQRRGGGVGWEEQSHVANSQQVKTESLVQDPEGETRKGRSQSRVSSA